MQTREGCPYQYIIGFNCRFLIVQWRIIEDLQISFVAALRLNHFSWSSMSQVNGAVSYLDDSGSHFGSIVLHRVDVQTHAFAPFVVSVYPPSLIASRNYSTAEGCSFPICCSAAVADDVCLYVLYV